MSLVAPVICSLFSSPKTYNTMGLLRLQSVIFTYYEASVNDECMVKYLLACSPSLKKIVIRSELLGSHENVMDATKVLKFHRASPEVDINVS